MKTSGNNANSTKVEFSQNLVKVFERRYDHQLGQFAAPPPVRDLIQRYLALSTKFCNHVQNTKYCLLYILKTHKEHYEEFKQIQVAKSVGEMQAIMGCEKEELSDLQIAHIHGTHYKKNKQLVKELSPEELETINKLKGTTQKLGKRAAGENGEGEAAYKRPKVGAEQEEA